MKPAQLELIHNASMAILANPGVAFHSEKALALFQKHGFKTDGPVVFFTEKQVQTALEQAPSSFTLHARNPNKNIVISSDDPALAPGYGFLQTQPHIGCDQCNRLFNGGSG